VGHALTLVTHRHTSTTTTTPPLSHLQGLVEVASLLEPGDESFCRVVVAAVDGVHALVCLGELTHKQTTESADTTSSSTHTHLVDGVHALVCLGELAHKQTTVS